MSQKCVEMLLGKILTDEGFRRSFFSNPAGDGHELELTPVERSALRTLPRERFEALAESLDARICRSCETGSDS